MANEEVFDDEFYQEDFSTASEWEAFVSRICDFLETFEVVDEEPLKKNQLSQCEWTEEHDDVLFNDFNLSLTRYKAKIPAREDAPKSLQCQAFQDLISMENDYCLLDTSLSKQDYENLNAPKPPSIHAIAVWFGLRDFVVIKSKRKALSGLSNIKLLQSSLSLAVHDSKCKIPAFVQIQYPEQEVYLGLMEHSEQRLSFDVIHLQSAPPSVKYLSGLLDLFKGKVSVNYTSPALVSVCLSYSLKNFFTATYSSDKKSDIDDWDVVDFINVISSLPFGVSADPVQEIILYTKWPQVSENVVFDSQTYSDFNPINAPKWSIRTRFDYTPVCYLADMLHEYLTLSESPEALGEYYNFLNPKNRASEAVNPFAALTESRIPKLPGMSMLESGSYTIDGPLNGSQMNQIFRYLFPDDDSEHQFPYGNVKEEQVTT